jgi:glyoxylate reductase
MERKKVYITRRIPPVGIELLRNYFDVEMNEEDRPLKKEEIIERCKDCDAVLTQLNDVIDEEVLDNLKNTKIIANFAVGFNNINIEAATEKGIQITNTPDVLTDTTAEMAWALLFSIARRVVEGDRYVREGKWTKFSPNLLLGQDINGKTLGIIGAGRIGKAFAKKSKGFNMKILYNNRNRDEEFEREIGAQWVDKDTLLKESDFISLNVPLTNETKHLIGEREFKLMKKTAILINTARGPVIDEKALVKALKEGEIWGAGLDVFENEPYIEKELLEMDNVVLTPHIGSASTETRIKMSKLAAENIIAVLNGKPPITPVNKL